MEASLPSGANGPIYIIYIYVCVCMYIDGTVTHTVKLYVSSNFLLQFQKRLQHVLVDGISVNLEIVSPDTITIVHNIA